MSNKQAQVSDESIIAAMLSSRTRADAAAKLKISPRQLFERLKSYSLQAALAAHRADALKTELQALDDAQGAAITCIVNIMQSDESTAAERLKAASLILEAGRAARQELAAIDADAVGKMRGAFRMDKQLKRDDALANGEFIL